jgi:beta-glucosidase
MADAQFSFPRGFLWGTATSSYQVEGANENSNWYLWEQDSHIEAGDRCGLACDWWGGRWREDFNRAEESGQNAHRLSVEWSRIQPTPDKWDENAIEYYRELVRDLVERGLTPMVSLHHFSNPLWLEEIGAWESQVVVEHFKAFVRKVVDALKEYVDFWITINEPNVYASQAYLEENFPPGKNSLNLLFKVITNLVLGHAAAYHAIHELQPEARVGMAGQYRSLKPAKDNSPLDKWVTGKISRIFNDTFPRVAHDGILRLPIGRKRILHAVGTQDFLGINYYTRENVAFRPFDLKGAFHQRSFGPGADLNPSGFVANEPGGLFEALKWGLQFNTPIYITECGVDDAEDQFRPRYLIQHIREMWRAVNFNWPVKGFFHWTLIDNFEWERGWTQRYGLWELDTETQARTKRKSADLYETICRQNALSSKMVEQYAPELLPQMFPG